MGTEFCQRIRMSKIPLFLPLCQEERKVAKLFTVFSSKRQRSFHAKKQQARNHTFYGDLQTTTQVSLSVGILKKNNREILGFVPYNRLIKRGRQPLAVGGYVGQSSVLEVRGS